MEILISAILHFSNVLVETQSDKISHLSAITLLAISVTIVPFALIFVMLQNKDILEHPKTKQNFQGVLLDLKPEPFYIAYNLLFIIRRSLIVIIMFTPAFRDHLVIQILSLIYLNFFVLIYLIWHKPYNSKLRN